MQNTILFLLVYLLIGAIVAGVTALRDKEASWDWFFILIWAWGCWPLHLIVSFLAWWIHRNND